MTERTICRYYPKHKCWIGIIVDEADGVATVLTVCSGETEAECRLDLSYEAKHRPWENAWATHASLTLH